MKKKINIIKELREGSKIFDIHGHGNTSKWIKFIADNLENDLISDYKKDFFDALDAFESDICTDEFRKNVHKEISLILGTALNEQRESNFNKILLKSYPLIHSWRLTRDKINQIGQLFMEEYKSGAIEKSFYLTTFAYLLEVEGSFDDIIRVLYILILASQKKRIQYEKIFTKRLKDIKSDFEKFGCSDILFKGWDDGHLRNAIAHARFTFDNIKKKMYFSDVIPWTNEEVYNESFSIADFSEKMKMIADVSHIFTDYIIMLRILDLIKHKWIERAR